MILATIKLYKQWKCKRLEPYIKTCDLHGDDAWACPDILFAKTTGMYGIPVRDGGRSQVNISYCPFCGKAL